MKDSNQMAKLWGVPQVLPLPISMNFLENQYLQNCSNSYKPSFYKRYIDDTLASFQNRDQNQTHPNIRFTIDEENNNVINFLDVSISRTDSGFTTNVYRTNCFTGFYLNFQSFISDIYKYNSCKTLIYTAYIVCSNWSNFTVELKILEKYFKSKCYPSYIFENCVKSFLNSIFQFIYVLYLKITLFYYLQYL